MIVATAGHVDHGKTALVRALTGVDTDRLAEEQARGLSIDLGFAALRAEGDGRQPISFVDVPGHQRYLRNMLSGLAHVDLALLVVAADDGVMPQTREHAAALDLLGLKRAAIVVTKIDRVDARRAAAAAAEARLLLAAGELRGAPVFRVCAPSGVGLAALAAHLQAEARRTPAAPGRAGAARLAVDRVFSVAGAGTVVTGTLVEGRLAVGDELRVSPSGLAARVRRLQVHDETLPAVDAGSRCAVNLAGIERTRLQRGDWLVAPALHAPARTLDVRLSVPAGAPPLRHEQTLVLHLAASSIDARVLLTPARELLPGSAACATLRLRAELPAWRGDRLLLRDAAGARIAAGGVVLDPTVGTVSRRGAAHAARLQALQAGADHEVLAALARQAPGFVDLAWFGRLCRLHRQALDEVMAAAGLVAIDAAADGVHHQGYAVAPERLDEALGSLAAALAHGHRAHPERAGETPAAVAAALPARLPPAVFAAVVEQALRRGLACRKAGLLHLPAHAARLLGDDGAAWARLRRKLEQLGPAAPRVAELAQRLDLPPARIQALLQAQVAGGAVLRLAADRFALRSAALPVAQVAQRVAGGQADGCFSAAQFRDALGTGRGLAIEWLECLDRQRVTVRRGDLRGLSAQADEALARLPPAPPRHRHNWRHRHRFADAQAPR
ncbi:MAG: selenocysteine-specific translation elongation factor [Proteobacteria bacterium]|nr:selenocysteine-specific translation elongation factor [Pseudomonadota bacterium]